MRVIRTTDTTQNLCDTCQRSEEFPLCIPDNVEFGNDNIIACYNCLSKYSETIYPAEIN